MKKYSLFIAAIIICTMMCSCVGGALWFFDRRCDKKLDSYKKRSKDLSIVGAWETHLETYHNKIIILIFEQDGTYYKATDKSQLKTKDFSYSGVWYTENNVIYTYRCAQYNIQNIGEYRYKIKNNTLYLQNLDAKDDSWAIFKRYHE